MESTEAIQAALEVLARDVRPKDSTGSQFKGRVSDGNVRKEHGGKFKLRPTQGKRSQFHPARMVTRRKEAPARYRHSQARASCADDWSL